MIITMIADRNPRVATVHTVTLSQSIRPLVARSDPIQGSPVAGSHLGGLSQLIELTKPYNALLGCLRVRLILP